MPTNRAGKVVRCPECKSTLQLRLISESEQRSGKPIPIYATIVEVAPTMEEGAEVNQDVVAAEPFVADDDSKIVAAVEQAIDSLDPGPPAIPPVSNHRPDRIPSKDPESANANAGGTQQRLTIPSELSPLGLKKKSAEQKSKLKQILAAAEPPSEFQPVVVPVRPKKRRARRVKPPEVPQDFDSLVVESARGDQSNWESRMQNSQSDRIVLSRFFALSLCVVAIVNLIPTLHFWYDWAQTIDHSPLPRWIYLQFFVAAIHGIYALFLFQVPDWSALRAVSVAMLIVAFGFGLVSASLLAGGGQGAAASFLGLSFDVMRQAAIWCVAMLCLATLMCYWGGREAGNWQRAEQLLEEILASTRS